MIRGQRSAPKSTFESANVHESGLSFPRTRQRSSNFGRKDLQYWLESSFKTGARTQVSSGTHLEFRSSVACFLCFSICWTAGKVAFSALACGIAIFATKSVIPETWRVLQLASGLYIFLHSRGRIQVSPCQSVLTWSRMWQNTCNGLDDQGMQSWDRVCLLTSRWW